MNNAALWSEYKTSPSIGVKKQIMVNYTNLVHYVIHNSKFMHLNVVEEKDFFQFGKYWEKDFFEICGLLGIDFPDVITRVTEFVP